MSLGFISNYLLGSSNDVAAHFISSHGATFHIDIGCQGQLFVRQVGVEQQESFGSKLSEYFTAESVSVKLLKD